MEFDKSLLEKISSSFIGNRITLAAAESVTAGTVQSAISQAKDASLFFHGGITAFNLGQKYKHLHVEPVHALSCKYVSAKVAEEMAGNVCTLFNSDYGIGITGFASKQPEENVDELFAFIAIAKKERILFSEKVVAEDQDSRVVQVFYTNYLLNKLSAMVPA